MIETKGFQFTSAALCHEESDTGALLELGRTLPTTHGMEISVPLLVAPSALFKRLADTVVPADYTLRLVGKTAVRVYVLRDLVMMSYGNTTHSGIDKDALVVMSEQVEFKCREMELVEESDHPEESE